MTPSTACDMTRRGRPAVRAHRGAQQPFDANDHLDDAQFSISAAPVTSHTCLGRNAARSVM